MKAIFPFIFPRFFLQCLVVSTSSSTMKVVSFLIIFGLIFSGIACSSCDEDADSFNVLDYGAISDEYIDNSQAFVDTWNAACNAESGTSRVVIPENMAFLVNPVIFSGPCNVEKIEFTILGAIVAPSFPSIWYGQDASQWLAFSRVRGLEVDGFGSVDGQGTAWWDQSCRYHPEMEGCTRLAPTALKFLSCNESRLSNVQFTNSAQTHVLLVGCNRFRIHNLTIQSPGNSPNTDGIHIQRSHTLAITSTKISTGDDCISIGDYASGINITNVECGPGHGISIGSLGRGGNYVQVENINVTNCTFFGTTNGARIKTWQEGKGYVRGVTFENLKFISVKNPIIIDQNYCDVRGACREMPESGVHISDVVYKTMTGTSKSEIAINLNCSSSVPCSEISMEAIQLAPDDAGKQVSAICNNAHGQETAVVPSPCLLHHHHHGAPLISSNSS